MYMKDHYSNKAVPWGMSNNCCSYLRVLLGAHTYSELKLGNYQWQGFFFYLPIGTSSVAFCLPWQNFNLVLRCFLTYFTFLYLNILYCLCVFTLMFFETVWLQFGHWIPIFHELIWFFRVLMKSLCHTLVQISHW